MAGIATQDVLDDLNEAIDSFRSGVTAIVIERGGRPAAALIPAESLERCLGSSSPVGTQSAAASECETCKLYEESERLAGLGHWMRDQIDHRFLYCSKELARLLGVSAEEQIRRSVEHGLGFPWVHPDDRARYQEAVRAFKARPSVFEIEYRLVRDDGSVIEVHEVATPILDQRGTLVRSIGYLQTIDDQRRKQAELSRINRLYEDGAQIARIGHWEWDSIEDRCTFCSPHHAEIYGLTVEGFLERARSFGSYITLIHPDDRLYYQRSIQRYRREKTRTTIEHRIVRDDGAVVPIRLSIIPVVDRDGRLLRSYGTVQDISAWKRSEESLQHSEAFLRQAAHVARFGTWIWDETEDRLVYGSSALAEILGYKPEELLRVASSWESYLEQVHPDDRARYERLTQSEIDNRKTYDVTYRARTAGGQYRYFRECGERVFDDRGRHVRTLGSLQDVQDSKLLEEALIAARAELERKVQERTARLTAANQALQAEILARKRAEQALRESEQQLRAIVDNSPSAIFLKDRGGRFQLVNDRFVEWYGIPRETLIGKGSDEVSSSCHLELYASLNRQVLSSGEALEHRMAVRFPDGRERPVRITKFPVRGEDGEMIGIGTFQTEIPE